MWSDSRREDTSQDAFGDEGQAVTIAGVAGVVGGLGRIGCRATTWLAHEDPVDEPGGALAPGWCHPARDPGGAYTVWVDGGRDDGRDVRGRQATRGAGRSDHYPDYRCSTSTR